MRRIRLTVFLCVIGVFLSALSVFAADPTIVSEQEQRLRERAASYWEAARVRDLATMYQMEVAAKRGRLTPDKARNALGTSTVLSYDFASFDISGDDAVVVVKVKYRLAGLRSPVPMTRRDPWTFFDGDWYHGLAGEAATPEENSDRSS